MIFDYTYGTPNAGTGSDTWLNISVGGSSVYSETRTEMSTQSGTNLTKSWSGEQTGVSSIVFSVFSDVRTANSGYTGAILVKSVQVCGYGLNPWTGLTGADSVRGDAFYYGYESGLPTAYGSTQGFRLDGAPVGTIPEYNENHEYTLLKTGTGNQFEFLFADSDYTDNQNSPLRVEVCGNNADS